MVTNMDYLELCLNVKQNFPGKVNSFFFPW